MPSPASCEPFFLPRDGNRLFSLACRPAVGRAALGVLLCPPFGEEMNRSRRTVRALCGELAARGALALSTDLRGTGDSSAEFGAAGWADWTADLRAAAAWLAAEGCARLALVAVRAGALLAAELLRDAALPVDRLVLWQPVLSGKAVLTDLLRARVAAAAAAGGSASVADLRGQLAAGEPVECAGYALAPGLAAALDRAVLDAGLAPRLPPTAWLEIGTDAAAPVRAQAARLVEELQGRGAPVTLLRAGDPPFWSTTETTVGRAAVAATADWLAPAA